MPAAASDPDDPGSRHRRAARREAFGARLRALRVEHGLTQETVALSAGMDRSFYVEVERGQRSLLVDRLDDLAHALGVRPADLLADEEPPD